MKSKKNRGKENNFKKKKKGNQYFNVNTSTGN